MLDAERDPSTVELDVLPSERVDLPQTYASWSDYAFSEFPEDDER